MTKFWSLLLDFYNGYGKKTKLSLTTKILKKEEIIEKDKKKSLSLKIIALLFSQENVNNSKLTNVPFRHKKAENF